MKLIFNVPAQQSAVELDSFIDIIVERTPECHSSVTHVNLFFSRKVMRPLSLLNLSEQNAFKFKG